MRDPEAVVRLARGAHARGRDFSKEVFLERSRAHFLGLLSEYGLAEGSRENGGGF
jgi:hypothetical protein